MKIAVIGTGYVGLVSGVCLASLGHEVVCVDKDKNKIAALENDIIPIFEPGLKELLAEVLAAKRISFTTNLKQALDQSLSVFIAVGTPQDEDGSADLSYVLEAAEEIAQLSTSYKLVVTKSTVPTGTGSKVKNLIKKTNPDFEFSVASNPEFLREGSAIYDFMNPDRIVIGTEDEKAKKILTEIYQNFSSEKLLHSDIVTAELIKYAANSFLATKIAFINEMADLCEKTGGNIKQLAYGLGLDARIGDKFLNPGPGFGGSCFPKDVAAILNIAQENGVGLALIDAVHESNKQRVFKMVEKIKLALGGDVKGKNIALLGLAFKGNTDDIRYSPAIAIAKELLKEGAKISATDPEAIPNSQKELKDFSDIKFFSNHYEALREADLIVIATEWKIYSNLDLEKIKTTSKSKKIVDLRNMLNEEEVKKAGFEYWFVGGKISE